MPKGYTDNPSSTEFDPIRYAKQHFPDDPAKFLSRYYDRRVMDKGGQSIFAPKRTVVLVTPSGRDIW